MYFKFIFKTKFQFNFSTCIYNIIIKHYYIITYSYKNRQVCHQLHKGGSKNPEQHLTSLITKLKRMVFQLHILRASWESKLTKEIIINAKRGISWLHHLGALKIHHFSEKENKDYWDHYLHWQSNLFLQFKIMKVILKMIISRNRHQQIINQRILVKLPKETQVQHILDGIKLTEYTIFVNNIQESI